MEEKLTKKSKDFYSRIGKMGGKKRKESGADFSAIAKLSHAPGKRKSYNGGRPKKIKNSSGSNLPLE